MIRGTLDEPADGATVADVLELAGWVLVGDSSPNVLVVLDGERSLRATTGIERPDVADAHPDIPTARFAGFVCRIDTVGLPDGDHKASIVVSADGKKEELARRRFCVANRLPPEVPSFLVLSGERERVANTLRRIKDENDNSYLREYLEYGMERFLLSLDYIPRGSGPDSALLDLGAFGPLTIALRAYGGYGRIVATAEPREDVPQPGTARYDLRLDGKVCPMEMDVFNVESDRFPYPEATFDTVYAAEVIEHLVLDPMHMVLEARRVLKPSGYLIVTTPNVTGLRNVAWVLERRNPVGLHTFSPDRHLYARHNHEYTPRELLALARAAGMEPMCLCTPDFFGPYGYLRVYSDLLDSAGLSARYRGDSIVLIARNIGGAICRHPAVLYKA